MNCAVPPRKDRQDEPACGGGHMSRTLGEYFSAVRASDLYPYGDNGDTLLEDFLTPFSGDRPRPDWLITNPPFKLGTKFALKALSLARRGVALLVRQGWLETLERDTLFTLHKPWAIAQFMGRLPMKKGTCLRKASTATS